MPVAVALWPLALLAAPVAVVSLPLAMLVEPVAVAARPFALAFAPVAVAAAPVPQATDGSQQDASHNPATLSAGSIAALAAIADAAKAAELKRTTTAAQANFKAQP